jgi:ubiquinone/menaquinone biosynthesis C-methylase UbiE
LDTLNSIDYWENNEGKSLFIDMLKGKNLKILDFGCGFGHYSFCLSHEYKNKAEIIALDINKDCLSYINSRVTSNNIENIHTYLGKKDYSIPYDPDTFNMILFYDIFHGSGLHRFTLLQESKRVLINGGILSILPFHLSNFTNTSGKKCKYTYQKIIDEVQELGFQLIKEKNKYGIHFEKVHSPYYINKGGVSFNDLEKGLILNFVK